MPEDFEKNRKLFLYLFDHDITQSELAKRSGVSIPLISMNIKGRYKMDTEQKQKIANALDCEVNEVF